jgi:glucokinase
MIVVPGGIPCPCGQRGCLEAYASAGAVARRVEAALEAGERSSVRRGADAAAIAAAAEGGDALCRRVWDEACFYLAIACINIQHAYNPEVILLGGGMAGAGDFLLSSVRAHFRANQWHLHDDFPRIEPARLGAEAGVVGAGALAWAVVSKVSK